MNSINVLINLLQDKIKELIEKIDNNSENIDAPSRVLQLAQELKENPFLIAEEDIESELERYFNELEDKELLKQILDDILVLKIVAIGKKKGISISLNEDELNRLERINNALLEIDKIYKNKNEQKRQEISANRVLKSKYSSLYDKLLAGENGTEHFTEADIDLLIELSSSQNYKFKLEILEYIRRISSIININILEKNTALEDEEEETNEIELDEDILKDLFKKYGYEYDNMPNKFKKLIRRKCKLQKIINLFEYIEQHIEELGFLKSYGKISSIPKSESILKNEFKKLYLMMRYATADTLDYIIKDAEARGVLAKDILAIEGVYKHISRAERSEPRPGGPGEELSVSGSFEYYKKNSIILDELSRKYQMMTGDMNIDFYTTTLAACPDLFKTRDDLLRKNIRYAEKHGLPLVEKVGSTYLLKSPTYLNTKNLQKALDVMLENPPLYTYICDFPSLLREDQNSLKAIERRLNGTLEFDSQGQLKYVRSDKHLANIDNKHIEVLAENIHPNLIEAAEKNEEIDKYINDEVINKLNAYLDNEHQNGLCFNINGVYVSKYKFYRVWTCIMNAYNNLSEDDKKNCNFDEMILYALTYNSYYTEEELDKLKGIVPGLRPGGIKK